MSDDLTTAEPWMTYRETAPSKTAGEWVANFWDLSVSQHAPQPFPHHVLAEPSIHLVWCWPQQHPQPTVRLTGPRLEPLTVPIMPRDRYRGIRLQPWANRAVLKLEPESLVHCNEPLESLGWEHAAALADAFQQSHAQSSYQPLHEFCSQITPTIDPLDEDLMTAIRWLSEQPTLSIDDIAQRLAISLRNLQRKFRREVGLSPKQCARLARARASAIHLATEALSSWASHAVRFGFSDQAHLTRELRKVSGLTPNQLRERLNVTLHDGISR